MINEQKKGCRDVWNAFMCDGASYSSNDIPICPTTAEMLPAEIIPWDEAKHIFIRTHSREAIQNSFTTRSSAGTSTTTSLTDRAESGTTALLR